MRRALRLAARGWTYPNPMVGCVIVREGEIVGEGYHPTAGQPHAELFALEQAGERARGATAYVTLEPCCHFGRTPPCTNALIRAGVGRVVAATLDADPRVRGQGLAALQAAGIATSVGLLEALARQLNEAFLHFHATGTPFITLKAAMTLDGKIATRTGEAHWITGEAARRYVHRLRGQSGAVLVGIGTLLADDPQLTARLPGRRLVRQPLRIVVDSRLRTPPEAQAVRLAAVSPDETPLLIATTENAPLERVRAL
ncbi:MAG TPA: bifunctional diaminohydroxyphosphoribosylaminopyrimidine deaminase/5-amino-6-(5-phosphoribosylamino)uracil reductase RibD, partial [Chthonomonadaceae bacterium]|nr:bifunctional diaminohydroxyphosphoribosylaminopyrimidine deaminase/5-amino-6-(5-phosphoribosylamino)uracil reductase RibD [Chthonomonadaceae bacterium]